MTLFITLTLGFFALAGLSLVAAVKRAPLGHEDGDGFHAAPESARDVRMSAKKNAGRSGFSKSPRPPTLGVFGRA